MNARRANCHYELNAAKRQRLKKSQDRDIVSKALREILGPYQLNLHRARALISAMQKGAVSGFFWVLAFHFQPFFASKDPHPIMRKKNFLRSKR